MAICLAVPQQYAMASVRYKSTRPLQPAPFEIPNGKITYHIQNPVTGEVTTMEVETLNIHSAEDVQRASQLMKDYKAKTPENVAVNFISVEEKGEELRYIHDLPQLDYDNVEKIKYRPGLWGKIADLGEQLSSSTKKAINKTKASIQQSEKL